jgi:hypothetical protein
MAAETVKKGSDWGVGEGKGMILKCRMKKRGLKGGKSLAGHPRLQKFGFVTV